jgi:hypothetical protein
MPAVLTDSVVIPIGGAHRIEADLVVRDGALGLVVFSHGSGSSRLPPGIDMPSDSGAGSASDQQRLRLRSPDCLSLRPHDL